MSFDSPWWVHFTRQWFRIAFHDAWAATFGWAAVPSGVAMLILSQHLRLSFSENWTGALIYALCGAFIAWFVAVLASLLITAPFKAYCSLEPFTVSIDDLRRAPDFICNDKLHGYNATVIVRNRSVNHLLGCSLHVVDIQPSTPLKFHRFVEQFDLPPRSEKRIPFAYWFSREQPNSDDETIGISGPVGPGFGGNVLRIPVADYVVTLRIQAPEGCSKKCLSRLWVDAAARRLHATLLSAD